MTTRALTHSPAVSDVAHRVSGGNNGETPTTSGVPAAPGHCGKVARPTKQGDEMMSEYPLLLPCPFCGGEASYEEHEGAWSVGCEDVDSNGIEVVCIGFQSLTTFARKVDAAAAWNRRATP